MGATVMIVRPENGYEVMTNLYQDVNEWRQCEWGETPDIWQGDILTLDSIHYCTDYEFTVILMKAMDGMKDRPHHQWPELTVRELNILIVKEWIRKV